MLSELHRFGIHLGSARPESIQAGSPLRPITFGAKRLVSVIMFEGTWSSNAKPALSFRVRLLVDVSSASRFRPVVAVIGHDEICRLPSQPADPEGALSVFPCAELASDRDGVRPHMSRGEVTSSLCEAPIMYLAQSEESKDSQHNDNKPDDR